MTTEPSGPPDDSLPAGLGAPARRALEQAGYSTLTELTTVTEAELSRLHGMGPKALGRLRMALAERGLTFAGE